MSFIYYFGPELTFSHQAADLIREQKPEWADVPLKACPTAEEILLAVLADPSSAAIVPFYNHVQGWVYDFLRFFLLEQVGELDLPIHYGLFAHENNLEGVSRIYTKDTVVPQVSHWLTTLPSTIEMISSHEMSTADAAHHAAQDPQGAAICSESAGIANHLTFISKVESNTPGNFTRFGLFVRSDSWWVAPAEQFESIEHPLLFNDRIWQRIQHGVSTLYWPLTLKPDTQLHLGHLSVLLTLRKFGQMGNELVVLIDRTAVDDHLLNNYWNNLLAIMGSMPFQIQIGGLAEPHWVAVDGIEPIQHYLEQERPAILLDYVPGTDGYAKMSTSRGNTLSWPLNAHQIKKIERVMRRHFTADRLKSAAFDWERGPYF